MATFSNPTFSYQNYASARPQYSEKLYKVVLDYHQGSCGHCVDVGTGHGLVARALSSHFHKVTGVDPSEGMLAEARELTAQTNTENIEFQRGTSEHLPASVSPGSVDAIVAAQAAHWFDYDLAWSELVGKLRPGGTIAFWGYTDCVFPDHPKASAILRAYSYGDTALNKYWTQPGRAIIEGNYAAIVPPDDLFEDLTRVDYTPSTNGPNCGKGEMLMHDIVTIRNIKRYVETWSAVHKWREANPENRRSRDGDIVDWMFDELAASDDDFKDLDNNVLVEWGTGMILARRRKT